MFPYFSFARISSHKYSQRTAIPKERAPFSKSREKPFDNWKFALRYYSNPERRHLAKRSHAHKRRKFSHSAWNAFTWLEKSNSMKHIPPPQSTVPRRWRCGEKRRLSIYPTRANYSRRNFALSPKLSFNCAGITASRNFLLLDILCAWIAKMNFFIMEVIKMVYGLMN